MKSKGMKKLLAVVMVLAMLISLFPAAVAEDGTAPGEEILAETLENGMPEDSYEGALGDDMQAGLEEEASGELTETPDAGRTEPAEESMGEAPEEAAEEAPTAPEEAAEEAPEEPEERKDEDTEAEAEAGKEELDEGTLESEDEAEEPSEEETEDKALPCGFRGLPEDYEFSEAELAAKRALTENGVVAGLAVGEYAEGEVLFSATTREYAELVAEAYNAELAYFNGHFGKLYLTGATVEEAVTAAADMGLPLPAVEPNWRVSVPILPAAEGLNTAQALFEKQNWQSWMDSTADPDPYMSDPGGAYQYQHDMVNTYEAWGVSTGAGVTVAVVDSGVDYTHPDLAGKVIPGRDYVEGDGDPMDENGHGTHVAGIIAAVMGNGEGGAGIAPDAKIYAVRVLDADGLGYEEWFIAGYYDAADSGAKIINMSLGGTRYSSIEEEAIRYAVEEKGATVVAAMGNDGSNIRMWPAGFDGVVAVAAVDAGGGLADYSDYGPWCDVAAPGSGIWSTTGGSYECWDGTSMATPVVAGVAALYMSRYGYTDPAAMEAILKKAVSKGPAGAGTGIIDASKLFAGDTTPPVIRLFEADGTEVTASGKVSPQGYLLVQSGRGITQATSFLLYTMDGKNPAVKNGNPTCGYLVSGVYAYEQELGGFRIPLGGFETDQSLTFKFMEVNGLAIPSKVSTLKVQIVPPSQDKLENLRINVQAPKSVTRGTSVTLTAEVWGSFDDAYGYTMDEKADDQTVVWSVAEPAGENWINASAGLLTVPVSFAGDAVVIRARSEAYDIEKDCSIGVESLPTVRSMRFTGKLRTLYTGEEYRLEAEALTITDVNGDPVDPRNASLKWSSSNTKVVSVVWDESGLPTFCANGKGSATVTGRTMDGSNQTVTLKLTVRPGMEMLTVTGQKIVAPGTSATYKVSAVTPKDAANKAVKWYVYTEDERITIDSKGKLTVSAGVPAETAFYVYAQPALGAEAAVTGGAGMVAPKAQKLELRMNAAAAPKTLTLFSADLPETDGADNCAEIAARRVLVGGGNDDSGIGVAWTSSKPDVAEVEEDGSGAVTVRAKKTGTATVTAKATDGSNKTARITVRVVNPVSHFIIRSKLPESLYCGRENMSYYAVGIGRSVGNSVIFGDTFGKPANTKVTWSLKCYLTEFGAGNVRLSMTEFDPGNNITVKNGTLTVNRRFQNAWENMVGSDFYDDKAGGKAVIVCVTATATDGSGASADIWYLVNRTTAKISLSDSFYIQASEEEVPDRYFFSETKNIMTLALDSYMGIADVDYDGWWTGFTVSSSKPEVAGATAYGDLIGVYPGTETGTAKITLKTTDGSNRSLSFNVKVVARLPVPATVITAQPSSVQVMTGETVSFRVAASGARLQYRWKALPEGESSWRDADLNGADTDTLSFETTETYNGWKFRCEVSGKDGKTVTSETATLTVRTVSTVQYRALLIAEVDFDGDVCNRNWGDVLRMTGMLRRVNGPEGNPYDGNIYGGKNYSPTQIRNAIRNTFAEATEQDVSLFFIATHGDVSNGAGSAYAGALSTTDGGWVLFRDLASWLNAIPGKVVVIVESCGSGAAIYASDVNQTADDTADERFAQELIDAFASLDEGIEEVMPQTGELRVANKFYVLTASALQQLSYGTESGPYNWFTKWLTDGVGTEGAFPADVRYGNSDGTVTLEELYRYISAVGDNTGIPYTDKNGVVRTGYQTVKRYPENSSYPLFVR